MPVRDPQPPLPLGLTPGEQSKALENSKTGLMRHAVLSAVAALFLAGFNAAFTSEVIWFPWPVAALLIIWLVHLQKYLSKAKSHSPSFKVWVDEHPEASSSGVKLGANPIEPESLDKQITFDYERSSRQRRREWLE